MPATRRPRAGEQFLLTDDTGTVKFEHVPINNYLISVKESKTFLGGEKRLDLVGERTIQPEFNVFIELKPQIMSFLAVTVTDDETRIVDNAVVAALLLTTHDLTESDRTFPIFNNNNTGYLFDLFADRQRQYQATLQPGNYILIVTMPGYMELNEYVSATKGECNAAVTLVRKQPSKLVVHTIDVDTAANIQGALVKVPALHDLQLSTANGSMNVEGLTDAEGKYEYTTDGCGKYSLASSREGYVTSTQELCISKHSHQDIIVPVIPLVPDLGDKAVIQICLSSDVGCPQLTLQIYCPISISLHILP
jgi:hypothetical protein